MQLQALLNMVTYGGNRSVLRFPACPGSPASSAPFWIGCSLSPKASLQTRTFLWRHAGFLVLPSYIGTPGCHPTRKDPQSHRWTVLIVTPPPWPPGVQYLWSQGPGSASMLSGAVFPPKYKKLFLGHGESKKPCSYKMYST